MDILILKKLPANCKNARLLIGFLILLTFLFALPRVAFAGGGPENLLLIVNTKSDSSKLIANHYSKLREIPAINVVYLDKVPDKQVISINQFRSQILQPINDYVTKNGLGNQIDYVVYSADFPTTITMANELRKANPGIQKNKTLTPHLSISSATYFTSQILAKDYSFVSLFANGYMRNRNNDLLNRPFLGEEQERFSLAIRNFRDSQRVELPDETRSQRRTEAETALMQIYKRHPSQVAVTYWLARIAAANENVDQTCAWLQVSIENGWCYRIQTISDSTFKQLRDKQQFRNVVNRIPNRAYRHTPTHGFRHAYFWGPNGMINGNKSQGARYLLSTVLAETGYRGTSEVQALSQIKASVNADGSRPKGKFYFSSTKNVRTRTRAPAFAPVIEELAELGYRSEVFDRIVPKNKKDVIGLCIGSSNYNIANSKSKIIPGAICENLTSFGGRLDQPGQTALTEFLKNGAAGSSGTVTEPFAIQAKFPHPRLYFHYALGCSLAEAFYQSVAGPFQLLIMGDALCQPWAIAPVVKVSGLTPMQTVTGDVNLQFDYKDSPAPVRYLELYVDGVLKQATTAQTSLRLDTKSLSDGYHELRIVSVAANAIETRGRTIIPIQVANQGLVVNLATAPAKPDIADEIRVTVQTNAKGAIKLFHQSRILASGKEAKSTFLLPARNVGRGPVTLVAKVESDGNVVSSKPFSFFVDGPLSDKPKGKPPGKDSKKPGAKSGNGTKSRGASGQKQPSRNRPPNGNKPPKRKSGGSGRR